MKTIRVRIAVAVSQHSLGWSAIGNDYAEDDDLVHSASRLFNKCNIHWVEADIPLPEPEVIKGRVVG